MERKLASIQVVSGIEPIDGADRIEKITVLGWSLVSKKDEFKIGDRCVFFEIDALLKDGPEWAEFMRPKKFRVKTIKLRGTLSQGLAMPLSILPGSESLEVGTDVSEQLGVTKYEPPLHDGGAKFGKARGNFPSFIPKTDEMRLQSCPELLDEIRNAGPFYTSVKVDGTSGTFCYDGDEFCACSRNWKKTEDDTNMYWQVARKYKLAEVLADNRDYAIQGEIAGPGIQGNKMRLLESDLFVFNVFDIKKGRILDYPDFTAFCLNHGLQTVPIEKVMTVEDLATFDYSLEAWLKRAEGNYESGSPREGIVVRPLVSTYSPTLRGRLSFKVINNSFLLRYGE
jgi:RNA ligase (TIGR02306 family)